MCHKQSLSHPAYIMIFCVMLYESYSSSIEHTSKATCSGRSTVNRSSGVAWGVLGVSWALPGASWDPLGHSWDPRGASLGPLGGSWESLGGGRRIEKKKRKKRMQHNDAKTILLASRGGSLVGRKHEKA